MLECTMPCRKHTVRLATLDPFLKSSSGISGYLASRFSLKTKIPVIRVPIIMRHRTCGDFHYRSNISKLSIRTFWTPIGV